MLPADVKVLQGKLALVLGHLILGSALLELAESHSADRVDDLMLATGD